MTPIRWLIVSFWIFIVGMLLWQFYDYDASVKEEAIVHPQQEHFFFYNTNAGAAPSVVPPPPVNGADVHQVGYSVERNKPGAGNFTVHVVLKNVGNAKATNIQVFVRPFRGTTVGDEDIDRTQAHMLSDNDPTSLYGQSLAFPDLAPGESATQTTVFVSRPGITPGTNPRAQINFQSEKANP